MKPHTWEDIEKEFKKTKFGKNGGGCFECCEYEEMYSDILSFFRSAVKDLMLEMVGEKKYIYEVAHKIGISAESKLELSGYNAHKKEMIKKIEAL